VQAGRLGVNGMAVMAVAGGAVLAYSGIVNASVADTLRALMKGSAPTGRTADSLAQSQASVAASTAVTVAGDPAATTGESTAAGGGPGQALVAAVAKYKGARYVFGAAGPTTFDCSGLVTYALHHDLGYTLPSNRHTTAIQFYLWSGAVTVAATDRQPGDLVCWTGHVGVYAGGGTFWDAPHTGSVVQLQRVWTKPIAPIYRRVKPQ